MQQQRITPEAKAGMAFFSVLRSFGYGLSRFWSARAGQLTFTIALARLRARTQLSPQVPADDVLSELFSMKEHEIQAVEYLSRSSQLVYATALFDSFLTESTAFLFMLHPKSMGKDHRVRLDDLLSAESHRDAVKRAAVRKARDESFSSFKDRLGALQSRYGFTLALDDAVLERMERHSALRNTVVHDQGFIDVDFDEDGSLIATVRRDAIEPVAVDDETIKDAIRAYAAIGGALSRAIYEQVLKIQIAPGSDLQRTLDLMDGVARDAKGEDANVQ